MGFEKSVYRSERECECDIPRIYTDVTGVRLVPYPVVSVRVEVETEVYMKLFAYDFDPQKSLRTSGRHNRRSGRHIKLIVFRPWGGITTKCRACRG